MKHLLLLPVILLLSACEPRATTTAKLNPLAGFETCEGFIELHVDDKTNQIYARLPKANQGRGRTVSLSVGDPQRLSLLTDIL